LRPAPLFFPTQKKKFMNFLHNALRKIIDTMGYMCVILMLLMVANVFYDVLMRYFFNDVSIGMQELEWHLFAAMFMFGIGYTLKEDGHVRVDIFYEKWLPHTQAKMDILAALVFALPIAVIVMYYGYSYTLDAYQMNEGSPDPGGLPSRWIIRSVIPLSNLFLILCIFYTILENLLKLKRPNVHEDHIHNEGV
jgi:TRAP-type mannitol/chloroaromatic compound transport system permease small subunit